MRRHSGKLKKGKRKTEDRVENMRPVNKDTFQSALNY